MPAVIDLPIDRIVSYCKTQPIQRLALFGSILRDDFGPGSDVDMLAELDADAEVGFFKLMRMQRELSEIVGRKVDLRTPLDLHPRFRDKVAGEAEVIFNETNGSGAT